MILKFEGIEIFEYCFLYTVCADDTTFFLKNENSIFHLSKRFKSFSDFSVLKPNNANCEIAGKGALKRSNPAIRGLRCIDLGYEAIKIRARYFSHNQKTKDEQNFYIISNFQGVLNLWRIRNLRLEGRMAVFKMLAKSKIVLLTLLTKIAYKVAKKLEKTQKFFLSKISTPRIKHETKKVG